MSSVSKALKDDGARRDAISLHDRSILVEAGAGSGKTAVMAGRIAAMLAEGVTPRSIAAVTFTELAASELLSRVREFVADLSAGTIATELRVALPDGLSQTHRDNLAAASAAIDEITCSTIHGFCQRLIKPSPAEADIDPGAGVMDRNEADLTFLEIVDGCANACPAVRAVSWPSWCCTAPARPWLSSIRSPRIYAVAPRSRPRPSLHLGATSRRSGRPRRISRTSWMARRRPSRKQ